MPQPSKLSLPTSDLSQFEGLALEDAIDLLKAYMFQSRQARFLKSGVRLYFSKASGLVFLADDRLNVAMVDNGELRQWAACRNCGSEGFVGEEELELANGFTCRACREQKAG